MAKKPKNPKTANLMVKVTPEFKDRLQAEIEPGDLSRFVRDALSKALQGRKER